MARRCDAVFLFVRLALDQFPEHPYWNLGNILEAIPTSLSVLYANIPDKQRNRSDQQFIPKFVMHTTRPLHLLEMADLINVMKGLED